MALFLKSDIGEVQWAVWKMEESLDELLVLLPHRFREKCVQELTRFTAEHRKKEWLSVRVLLYTVLSWGDERDDVRKIEYSPDGKPFLNDRSYHISISHTQGYVALAWSRVCPVGIDIEQYGQRIHRVVSRFVRPDEVVSSYLKDDTWSLLLHWSSKEAVFKRMETPDADLRKLCLSAFVPEQSGTFDVQEQVTEAQVVYRIGYRIHPDFVLTWTLN